MSFVTNSADGGRVPVEVTCQPAHEFVPTFFYSAAIVTIFAGLTQNAFAPAPFDCSARVIVHEDSAKMMVTVGSALGEHFLRTAQLAPAQLPPGHPFALNVDMAANFFTVAADGKIFPPRTADVVTDGLEFQFHFEYALAPTKTLRLQSQFLPTLRPPQAAPLVLTDENGNILASAILSPGKDAADFALPEKLFPQISVATVAPVLTTNPPIEKPASTVAEVKTQPSFGEFLRFGIGHILNVEAFDHLLFLTALLLGCQRLKPMLLVITGFTLALVALGTRNQFARHTDHCQ